jgi:hypothetical protein
LRIGKLLKTELDSTTVEKSKIPKIKQTKTPGLPSTSSIGSSLCFPMVHFITPNGQRITSYDCRKLDWFAESEFWVDWTFWSKSGFWQSFVMTFPETLNIKVADNELSFTLVTHMAYSDARFGNYGILKSGRGAKNFLDRLCRPANNLVLRAEDAQNLMRVVYKFRRPLTQLSNAYSHAHFQ